MNLHEKMDNLELAVEELVSALDKDKLKSLENEEAILKRLLTPSVIDIDDWLPLKHCHKWLEEIWCQQRQLRRKIFLHQQKFKFQNIVTHVDTQAKSIPLNLSFDINQERSRERDSGINLGDKVFRVEIAFKQELLNLYWSLVPIYDDDIQEPSKVENSKAVIKAYFVEVIDDLKGDVEESCEEVVDDLEEGVETTRMKGVGCRIKALRLVDSYPRLVGKLQV